ncbi:MAG: DUF58 domain-containing protein [Acidimicrobiia bacterium]|nr:DUF58 domain-containing protein [Acidimicrobiia bacterium]
MNRQTSPRYVILLLGGVAGLVIGVVAGSPALAVLAAPAVLLATISALVHTWPDVELDLQAPGRAVEGDLIDLVVTVESLVGVPWLHLELELPPDLEPIDGIQRAVVAVPPGRQVVVKFPVELKQWGVSIPGRLLATARDPLGMFVSSTVHTARPAIRVHPRDGNRRSVVAPARLRPRVGDHRSRRHGEGSDFAEVRPYRPGDPARSVNWRVSARRREPWVTVRHPDQSGDLVFVLDTFCDLGTEGNRLVQRAVRAAMGLAESNLDAHDRVGLLDVGRHIRWFRPRLGRLHQARLFDALLETQVEPGLRAPRVEQLPLHDLDAGTMIVMLTGLADDNMARLPGELRKRGSEVVVLEVVADDHMPTVNNRIEVAAARIWRLQRARRRRNLISHGVTVVPWSADQPLDLPVAAMARREVVTR